MPDQLLAFAGDTHEEFRLSADLAENVGFGGGLWHEINAKHDVIIDAYEREDLPPAKLGPIAADMRQYAAAKNMWPEVREELLALAAFLDAAAERGTWVGICL